MVPPELGGEPKRDQYLQVAPDGAFFFNEQQILYTDRRSAALSSMKFRHLQSFILPLAP
jgi:hypothetical protein